MSYYQMQRGWQDHHLFAGDKYSRRDAWEWLVANAAWKDTSTGYHGKKITLKRGQLAHSIRFLAEKWGWTASKVQRFLCSLKTDTMIDTATDTGRLLITICNYDIFQSKINLGDTATDTTSDTPPIQQRYKEEEDKNKIKERKERKKEIEGKAVALHTKPEAEGFEDFKRIFPKQRAGNWERAEMSYRAALKRGATPGEILSGVSAYQHSDEVTKGFAKGAAAWLNDDRWSVDYSIIPQAGAPPPAHVETDYEMGQRILREMKENETRSN